MMAFKDDFKQLTDDLTQLTVDYKDLLKKLGTAIKDAEKTVWQQASLFAKDTAERHEFYDSGYDVGIKISEWCMEQSRKK